MSRRAIVRCSLLFVFVLLCSPFPLFRGVLFLGDTTFSFHPWLTYAAQEIQVGRLPLWNPHSSCGEPFLANPQTMIFYPPALLYWIFPYAQAAPLFAVVQQFLLFVAVVLVALRWRVGPAGRLLAAVAITWGGFTVTHWEFPSAGATLPWVFFLLLFSTFGSPVPVALAAALAIFAGYTPLAQYGFLLASAQILVLSIQQRSTRPARRWFLGIALALCLTAPLWGPTLELARASLRTGVTESDARAFLLTPALLLKNIFPRLIDPIANSFAADTFGSAYWPIRRNWMTTFTLGTPVILLGAVGFFRRKKFPVFWAAVVLLSTALATGTEPVWTAVRMFVPGFRYMTHFSNALFLAILAWAFLAARVLTLWDQMTARKFLAAALLLAGVAAGGVLSETARAWVIHSMIGAAPLTPAQDVFVQTGFAFTFINALLCAGATRTRHAPWVLLILTTAELMGGARALAPVAPSNFYQQKPVLADMLVGQRSRFAHTPASQNTRAMAGADWVEGYQSLIAAGHPSTLLPYRVSTPWGYETFALRDIVSFRRLLPPDKIEGSVAEFMGVNYLASLSPMPPPYRPVGQRPNALLWQNPRALERVTWVPEARPLPSGGLTAEHLASWDPRKTVFIPDAEPKPSAPPRAEAHLVWDESPGRVALTGHGEGWVVYSAPFYPGWMAWINGRPAPILKANGAFMALATPDGPWRGLWMYRPVSFFTGLGLFLLTGGGMAGFLFRRLHGAGVPSDEVVAR